MIAAEFDIGELSVLAMAVGGLAQGEVALEITCR